MCPAFRAAYCMHVSEETNNVPPDVHCIITPKWDVCAVCKAHGRPPKEFVQRLPLVRGHDVVMFSVRGRCAALHPLERGQHRGAPECILPGQANKARHHPVPPCMRCAKNRIPIVGL
eukprot:3864403-Rhodomonas_salina.1